MDFWPKVITGPMLLQKLATIFADASCLGLLQSVQQSLQAQQEVQQFALLGSEEENNQSAGPQTLYHHTNSYVGTDSSVSTDYIQPYHIFQVSKYSQPLISPQRSFNLCSDGPAGVLPRRSVRV